MSALLIIIMRFIKGRHRLGPTDKILYGFGLAALALAMAAVLLYFCTGINVLRLKWTCTFNKVTGYCCPGCGGTRAFRALMHGEILKSFYDYFPLPYALTVYVIFMVRRFIYRWFGRGKIVDGSVVNHIYVFVVLVFVQWFVKLGAQFFFDYYWFL